MKHLNKKTKQMLMLVFLALFCHTSVMAQLNGTYTVYGAGANYATLQDAANALNAGVSGPVVFKVRPGTWTDPNTTIATIGNVAGASSTNTITFEAENGSAATTTIVNTASSSSTTSNVIFYFNGAKYVRVRNLTLNKSNTTYGTVLRFDGDADFNIIENCVLTGATTTSTSTSMARVFGSSLGNANDNIIRYNTFISGSYGVYWYGTSVASQSNNNEFSNNTLTSPYNYGFNIYYASNLKVLNNTITRTGGGTFYGFYLYECDGAYQIDGNTYTGTGITSTNYVVYANYCDATASVRGSISNNIFTVTSSTTLYGMYVQYGNYYTIGGNKITLTNTTTQYPLYNYNYNSSTAFTYGKQCYINNNEFISNTTGAIQMYGHYYYQQDPQFNNNKLTFSSGAGGQTLYLGYYYQYNLVMNGNTMNLTSTTGALNVYNGYYYGENGFEFNNNVINMNSTSGSQTHYAGYYTYYNTKALHYNNNQISMISSTTGSVQNYFGYYNYTSTATGNEMKGNTITLSTNATSAYNYMGYYYNGLDLSDNTVYVKSNGAAYGIYSYGNSSGNNPWIVKNNRLTCIGGTSTVYAFYNYYASNLTFANNVIYAKGNSTCYGYIGGYNSGGGNFYNNTIHSEGTSTTYTFYVYESSGSQYATIRNNVISRSAGGSGYLVYGYQPQFYNMDYNNFWASGGTLLYWGGVGTTYTTVASMRTGMNNNHNSLSYNPGFVSPTTGDLRPDPANPNSWSLNGRGVQLANNDKDVIGSPRALTTVQGVPDIGAYEFTPTATPPNCTLVPAAPVASGTQYAYFGEDTVAVIRWGSTVPTGFAVKQYTGTNPPGITAINPTQMFYYADFLGSGTALDYSFDLYFKDPWMGSIASKAALRLAEKVGATAWTGYPSATSIANVTRNYIRTPGVMNIQSLYTGIDVPNNASADAIIEPVPPFCPGTYAVKLRIKNNGNNIINNVKIDWQLNGGAITTINYTTPINVNGSGPGNEAIIPLGNIAFGSSAVNIKAWTYQPNGVTDPIPGDDTLNKNYFAALGGVYTVGGVTPNFPTVVDAVNALNQYGTCGNVIFDIRPGTYTGKVILNNPTPVPSTSGRVTFRSETGVASSVTIAYNPPSQNDPTIQLNNADNFTFRNLSVTTGPSYGQCFALNGSSDNDSIMGCILSAPTVANSYNSVIMAYTGYTSFNGNNLVIKDNIMTGGYYAVWVYPGSYQGGIVIDNNTITDVGYMGMYIFNTNGIKIRGNTLSPLSTASAYYGIYCYYAYQSPEITNNKLSGFYGYGLMAYYAQGSAANRARIENNSVIMKSSTTCYYPFYCYYPLEADIRNNTFVNNGTSNSSYFAAYIYIGTMTNNKLYNNVFANLSGGGAAYMYANTGYGNDMNYNNLYTPSTSVFMSGSATASSLATWRTGSGYDMQSVSYDPAITSQTDPKPSVTNPACWALNGHALQITGNVKDIDGNTRIDNRVNGVPDIGAYEIDPEVAPPPAVATPATVDPGMTQVFTFAGNEVGQIKWGLKAPTVPVEVRQYSGEKGAGVAAAASPSGSMYFHTDIKPLGSGTTYDFNFNLDYMDIWLGDIATEGNLRLAHQVTGYPWMVYSGSLSTINATTNNIDASELNRFGSFTALENNSVPSAFVRAQGSVIICIGNNVQLNAEPQDGDYYKWYRNGTPIAGAEGATAKTYMASLPGDYSVAITFSGKVVESVPVTVSTIAPPNAIVAANRPLTYCPGNGLTLNAGTGLGLKYQWQLNGNDIPGATGNTYPVNQAGNYTVVVANVGCATVSTVTPVTSGPINVELGNDTSYCEIKNVYMTLDAGYPGAKYLWSTGDTTKTIEVKKGGTYTVDVDAGPNCQGSDAIAVTIDPLPKANGISFVQNGNSYQFFPSGPVGAVGFLWLFSDGTTSTQAQPTKTITGDLYVRLVMFNACGSDTVQLGWPLSVQSVADGNSLSVYPNPASTTVTVSANGILLQEVEVLNSVGSVVYRSIVNGANHSINVSGLANGHYMLRATTDAGMVSKQFDVLK